MSDNVAFHELYRFLHEANDDTLKVIGVSVFGGELFPAAMSNAGDDNKQPDLDPHALQASRSEPNFAGKGKRRVHEASMPQVSTPATPRNRETYGMPMIQDRQATCEARFKYFLTKRGDPYTTYFLAGALCRMLKELGMSPVVTDYEMLEMLEFSGYTDADGTLHLGHYNIFAKDFYLLESLHASRMNVPGPLGVFFEILRSGTDLLYSNAAFSNAFGRMGIQLTDENADNLARFANMKPELSGVMSFEQFATGWTRQRDQDEHMQRTGERIFSHTSFALDKSNFVGRLMAFVSKYTGSGRALGIKGSFNAKLQ